MADNRTEGGEPLTPPEAMPPTRGQGIMVYERAKAMATDPRGDVRLDLAGNSEAPPELLFYLSDDDDPRVLAAVAANPATPLRAAPRLARARQDDVRSLLAGKLARQLPDLQKPDQEALRGVAEHALEMLAADKVVRVRSAVASAIREIECVPHRLAAQLARDIAREVAEPILRSCALLSDAELLDLVRAQPLPWIVQAVAARPALAPLVADAVIDSDDAEAIQTLADNSRTSLAPTSLERLVAKSRSQVPLQESMARRPELNPKLARVMAEFVEETVRRVLAERADFDAESRNAIAAIMSRRLDFAKSYASRDGGETKAIRLFKAGRLTEEAVWDALSWGDRDFVRTALALLADTTPETVQRVLDTQSPKAATALSWRAGLSMRCAREVQARGSGIPPRQVLNARHGTEYPLTEAEMNWQLEFFDIPL
jgi:uncharacterized protein (DUF2336 family)